MLNKNTTDLLIKELTFKTKRSSGAGGQNVNKVETAVQLFFNLEKTEILTIQEKEILFKKINSKINKDGFIILECSETRSQFKNKELVINKFLLLIEKNLLVNKDRIKTKPTMKSVENRILEKTKNKIIKQNRNKNFFL